MLNINRGLMEVRDTVEADILLFMGQSNMAGRGDWKLAPQVPEGTAYEYRAVTRPDTLAPLAEPFGVDENRLEGVYEPGMKTGSMAAAFVNACYRETKRPIIAVSCAKGGSSINEWLPGTPYFADAADRFRSCMDYVKSQGITVRSTGLVWCQGCTDADNGMEKEEYKQKTRRFLEEFMKLGVETVYFIQIGNHREEPDRYVPMQEAQQELAEEHGSIELVCQLFKTFRERGLMKDSFHYKQEAYNLVGEAAGKATGLILKKKENR